VVPYGTPTMKSVTCGEGRQMLAGGLELAQMCCQWLPRLRATAVTCEMSEFCQAPGNESAVPPTAGASSTRTRLPRPSVAVHTGSPWSQAPHSPAPCSRQALGNRRIARSIPELVTVTAEGVPAQCPPAACQCPGNCQQGHRKPATCSRAHEPAMHNLALLLCIKCRCEVEGCAQPKFRQRYCFHHAYMHLSIEYKVICQASTEGVLHRMMPLDIEALFSNRPCFHQDEALQFIAAWIMEPAAIRSLAVSCPKSDTHSGQELSRSLQQVRAP
jgi:hypothetical protein